MKLPTHLIRFHHNDLLLWVDYCSQTSMLGGDTTSTGYCYALGKLGGKIKIKKLSSEETVIKHSQLASAQLEESNWISSLQRKIQLFWSTIVGWLITEIKDLYDELTQSLLNLYIKYLYTPHKEPHTIILKNKNDYLLDQHKHERFIAHAGGEIERFTYTNSLEALNKSYQDGFRIFELDIIKTRDNVYVAAHDWKQWKAMTMYKGRLPPDRNTFKKFKISGKFTSMDIQDINTWFHDHPDATLVTDKVNDPKTFSQQFVDKKRLMMELFTWDAVQTAQKIGIKSVMPTAQLLFSIRGNIISFLKRLGIKHIAISRTMIYQHRELLSELVNSKFKLYAFHINKNQDEEYVLCNESSYFYGMYADKWNFNRTDICKKYGA